MRSYNILKPCVNWLFSASKSFALQGEVWQRILFLMKNNCSCAFSCIMQNGISEWATVPHCWTILFIDPSDVPRISPFNGCYFQAGWIRNTNSTLNYDNDVIFEGPITQRFTSKLFVEDSDGYIVQHSTSLLAVVPSPLPPVSHWNPKGEKGQEILSPSHFKMFLIYLIHLCWLLY